MKKIFILLISIGMISFSCDTPDSSPVVIGFSVANGAESTDIFATPLYGYLLDTYEGINGHQLVYLILAVSSLIGISVSLKFKKINKIRYGFYDK